MKEDLKLKIYDMVNSIQDENILQMLMDDVAYYTTNKDITDDLNHDEIKELGQAIVEADNKDVISWDTFKKEMNEWKNK